MWWLPLAVNLQTQASNEKISYSLNQARRRWTCSRNIHRIAHARAPGRNHWRPKQLAVHAVWRVLGIRDPNRRVMRLRREGNDFKTVWCILHGHGDRPRDRQHSGVSERVTARPLAQERRSQGLYRTCRLPNLIISWATSKSAMTPSRNGRMTRI